MSNIGNPNCCCDIGLHYPWLTFETNTFGANGEAAYPNQIVRTPAVTVSPTGTHHAYRYCNFIIPSGELDDGCETACYDIPTIGKPTVGQEVMRIEVENDDGCWGSEDCKDTGLTKHYFSKRH